MGIAVCALTFLPLIELGAGGHVGVRKPEMIGVIVCRPREPQQVREVKLPQEREKTNASLFSLHRHDLPGMGSRRGIPSNCRLRERWHCVETFPVSGNRLSCVVTRGERKETCI